MTNSEQVEAMFARNRAWAAAIQRSDPTLFGRLVAEHAPHTMFIGCSDARVTPNVITQTDPGELFVHRNIANLVVPTDTNLLAAIEYAVGTLRVRDIIVCGHYGCGGVAGAMGSVDAPHVDSWVSNIRTVMRLQDRELSQIADEPSRCARLVELNVVEQVRNLSRTAPVRDAWAAGSPLRIHGAIYSIRDGLLRDLGASMDAHSEGPGVDGQDATYIDEGAVLATA
jgi:carbonic anhydrase